MIIYRNILANFQCDFSVCVCVCVVTALHNSSKLPLKLKVSQEGR